MKNFDLAKKIKDLRSRKGISQEELADKSGLSLRTIQRIENGENEARGDTLQRLSIALEVATDDLVDWTVQEDKTFLSFLNLSALSFLAFPLLSIVIPLVLWVFKKGKIKHLDETSKRLLNFQISWCLVTFIVSVALFTGEIFDWRMMPHFKLGALEMIILTIVVLYLINIVFIIVNTIRCLNEKPVFYQPAFKFLR